MAALAGGDPSRLLATVLQRVEAEVGQPGDVVAGCVYAKDAALVARTIAVDENRLGQQKKGALSSRFRGTFAQAECLPRQGSSAGPLPRRFGLAAICGLEQALLERALSEHARRDFLALPDPQLEALEQAGDAVRLHLQAVALVERRQILGIGLESAAQGVQLTEEVLEAGRGDDLEN